jgi:hypothetical protein
MERGNMGDLAAFLPLCSTTFCLLIYCIIHCKLSQFDTPLLPVFAVLCVLQCVQLNVESMHGMYIIICTAGAGDDLHY